MYEDIMNYEDFKQLSEDDQKKVLTEYRNRFPNKDIMEKWGLDSYQYYQKLIKGLGIKTERRTNNKPKKTNKPKSEPTLIQKSEQPKNQSFNQPLMTKGTVIKINGKYSSERIQSKLEKLALLLEEDSEYIIELSLIEKDK